MITVTRIHRERFVYLGAASAGSGDRRGSIWRRYCDNGGCRGCRGCWGCEVWAQRRFVDYRNVCFPSERLSQPNDAFGTRVRARSLDPSRSCSLPLAPTTHERGQRHCAPLTASRDRDKLANDRLLASPRLVPTFNLADFLAIWVETERHASLLDVFHVKSLSSDFSPRE